MSDFNKDYYYIPLEIKFITESKSRKEVLIPVSVDIMKFLEKTKINYENVKDK